MRALLAAAAVLAILSASCARAQEGLLREVTFCHGLDEGQRPKNKAEFFLPEETIYVSVELKGRPSTGVVTCRFHLEKDLIAEAKVDVATLAATAGPNTFVGFHLLHEKPLPVGSIYHADISFEGKALGTFPFRVAPPKEAMPSKLKSTEFQTGLGGKREKMSPAAALAPEDEVFLQGVADLGMSTWLRATWLLDGKPQPESTRMFTMEENRPDCGFFFSFRPETGWPKGKHAVILELNGEEVARPTFEVKEVLPTRVTTEIGQLMPVSFSLVKMDSDGSRRLTVGAFSPQDLVLTVEWKLKTAAKAAGVKFVWSVVDAGGRKNEVIATALPGEGIYRALQSSLTTKRGLPPGRYRVDLVLNDDVLDSQTFEVR